MPIDPSVSAGGVPDDHLVLPTMPPSTTINVRCNRSDAGVVMQFTNDALDLIGDLGWRFFSKITQSFPCPELYTRFSVRYVQDLFQIVLRLVCVSLARRC